MSGTANTKALGELVDIRAVLKGRGEDWTPGYKPAFDFQASLVDAVVCWLQGRPDWPEPLKVRWTVFTAFS